MKMALLGLLIKRYVSSTSWGSTSLATTIAGTETPSSKRMLKDGSRFENTLRKIFNQHPLSFGLSQTSCKLDIIHAHET